MKKYWIWCMALLIWFGSDCYGIEEEAERVSLPIIMYHNISKNQGKLGRYVITPGELEQDLVFLKEQGYQTVNIADVTGFVRDGAPLPPKPVMLTFDDGDYSTERYALPLLEKYEMKAVVSIIGKITDEYSAEQRTDIHFPNLTWGQVNRLLDSGCVEIQSHTYDLHKGCGVQKKQGETDEAYKERLCCDLRKMNERIEEMTSRKATAVVYPFGRYSTATNDIAKELGFAASLNCREKMNILEKGNADCLYGLGRYLRPHGKPVRSILG